MSKVAEEWGRFLRAARKRGGEERFLSEVNCCENRDFGKIRNQEQLGESLFGLEYLNRRRN